MHMLCIFSSDSHVTIYICSPLSFFMQLLSNLVTLFVSYLPFHTLVPSHPNYLFFSSLLHIFLLFPLLSHSFFHIFLFAPFTSSLLFLSLSFFPLSYSMHCFTHSHLSHPVTSIFLFSAYFLYLLLPSFFQIFLFFSPLFLTLTFPPFHILLCFLPPSFSISSSHISCFSAFPFTSYIIHALSPISFTLSLSFSSLSSPSFCLPVTLYPFIFIFSFIFILSFHLPIAPFLIFSFLYIFLSTFLCLSHFLSIFPPPLGLENKDSTKVEQ